MALSPAELAAQIAVTRAFVAADELSLVFRRVQRLKTSTGGLRDGARQPIGTHKVRLVPVREGGEELSTTDGRRIVFSWTLVALPGSGLQRGDQFDWQGKTWEIAQIHLSPEYILKGGVVERGGDSS